MMDRRQFIKITSRATLGLVLTGTGKLLHASTPSSRKSTPTVLDFSVPLPSSLPRIVIVKGNALAGMVKKAITAIGGMERFISKGDLVVLKPNASFDSGPEQGANTHPEIVGVLTELSLKAGAREVVAIDHTLDEPRRCFARSGIGPAVKKAGGKVEFQGERRFREIDLGGEVIGTWPVMKALFEADKFINIPIVKQHGLSKLTASMKNLFGVVGGNRPKLHWRINKTIVDLASFVRPTLVVLDSFSVMISNGPSGGRPDDLIHPHTIAVGTDQVAMDAYAASFLGLKPKDVGYIALAHKKRLGSMDYRKMRTKKLNL